jgi:hypothetical protein
MMGLRKEKGAASMSAITATWKNGQIVPDRPVDWPEGCRLKVEPETDTEVVGLPEDEWPTDAEGIARLLARMEQVKPFDMTPEEEAEIAAWRQKVKAYTLANQDRSLEGLFE